MSEYFQLACPYVQGVYSTEREAERIPKFIEECRVAKRPAFRSLYTFTDGKKKWDRESIILDKVKVDIDMDGHGILDDEALQEARELVTQYMGNGWSPYINFSGNSGFGIELEFEELDVVNKHETLREFLTRLVNATEVNIDRQALLATKQNFRIINSVHQKTGLYVIPLTVQELFTLDATGILELAKEPRELPYDHETVRKQNKPVRNLLAKTSRLLLAKKKSYNQIDIRELVKNRDKPRPCIQNLIEKGVTEWKAMSYVCMELVALKWTKAEIVGAFKELWNNANENNFDAQRSSIEIERLVEKNLVPPSCRTLHMHGYCDGH